MVAAGWGRWTSTRQQRPSCRVAAAEQQSSRVAAAAAAEPASAAAARLPAPSSDSPPACTPWSKLDRNVGE